MTMSLTNPGRRSSFSGASQRCAGREAFTLADIMVVMGVLTILFVNKYFGGQQ
jgi:hypothetical protein